MSTWVRTNTVVALTLLGLFTYAMFSIPADVFYARLGTTPTEVGYTYATLLSGSTLGVLLVVGFILYVFIILGTIFVMMGLNVKQGLALGHYLRRPRLFVANDRLLNADDFEFVLAAKKRQYGDVWEELEPILRRQRAFEQIKNPTPLEKSELKKIRGAVDTLTTTSFMSQIARLLRPRTWHIPAVLFLLVAATIILTLNAQEQAGNLAKGVADITATRLGLFGYHVEAVTVKPAGPSNDQTIKQLNLDKESLYFLGQNSQYIIFYDAGPRQHQIVRIPGTEVVVISSR
jgi:hypothetical protein